MQIQSFDPSPHQSATPRRGQVFSVLAIALTALTAAAQPVSPADRASYEGSSSTSYPLGRVDGRFQQLHGDLPAGTRIQGHAYRRDAISLRGQVVAFKTEMSVELSMSPRLANAPSRTFTDNHGANPTLVLPKTWVSFPMTDRPPQDPAGSFALKIPYATPFAVPAAGGVLCVDMRVFGNQLPSGNNKTFTAYLDAHAMSATRNVQPGYRYGAGCPAPGRRSAHYCAFSLTQRSAGHDLKISSRYGIPNAAGLIVLDVLILGLASAPTPWGSSGCTLYPTPNLAFALPGTSDTSGHHTVALNGLPGLPIGQRLYAQIASGELTAGALTFSDGSILTIPPAPPAQIPASRIANGSDGSALTGTTSYTVPVTQFY